MNHKCIIIGISGASGSGKTSISETLVNEFHTSDVALLKEDYYYKNIEDMPVFLREQMNFDHPDSLDHDLLIEDLLKLRNQQEVDIPQYDYVSNRRKTTPLHIKKNSIIVIEGILLFSEPRLRELLDIKIFVETPLDICLLRRVKRDIIERGRTVESVLEQYEKTVRPMYLQFIEPCKRYADIIIPRGGQNFIAIDLIKAKMNELLR